MTLLALVAYIMCFNWSPSSPSPSSLLFFSSLHFSFPRALYPPTMSQPSILSTRSALLVLDIQSDIVDRIGCSVHYLQKLDLAINRARRSFGTRVIFVTTSFRRRYPDLHPRNKMAPRVHGHYIEDDPGTKLHPGMTVSEEDIFVTKKRVSAFAGSDLELILRSLDINHLILAGVITSGAVLSTARQAADLDFQLTFLKDLCVERDVEVHNILMERVFPRQGRVVDSDEWLADLGV